MTSTCVSLAPGTPRTGDVITGLGPLAGRDDLIVFHAGTARRGDDLVTSGGRVLGVTALGDGVDDARRRAYDAVGRIHFDGMQYRRDIGHRALKPRTNDKPTG